jgi:hypothetical protein
MPSTPKVRLDVTSARYIDVYWESPDGADVGFTVLRGESPAGPFEQVSDVLHDRFHIRDAHAPRLRTWRTLHYVVRATDAEGNSVESEPTTLRAPPPLDALEMIRLNGLLFREYTGRPCLVLARRTFGKTCDVCYDPVTHEQLVGKCSSCYGVGYARGYHFPMYAYINISPETQALQPTQSIVTAQSTVQARMSVYPLVKPGDIVIEREGARWRVQNVSATERMRAPVQQILTLFRIPEGDIEHSIAVEWREEVTTSPRSFNTRSTL